MARFEAPIEDQRIAEALRGLDLQSVLLARDFEQSARLHAFVDEYVDPEILEHITEDGVAQSYGHRRISAIGDDGSLLHVRVQQQTPGVVGASVNHLAVISHVKDPNPASVLLASSHDTIRFDSTRETRFSIGSAGTPSLQVVEAPLSRSEWDMQSVLDRELAIASLPLILITQNGWEYRRSDGHWEKLSDIKLVQERVSRALSQGLGYASMPEVRPQPEQGTGQYDQKMVG